MKCPKCKHQWKHGSGTVRLYTDQQIREAHSKANGCIATVASILGAKYPTAYSGCRRLGLMARYSRRRIPDIGTKKMIDAYRKCRSISHAAAKLGISPGALFTRICKHPQYKMLREEKRSNRHLHIINLTLARAAEGAKRQDIRLAIIRGDGNFTKAGELLGITRERVRQIFQQQMS